MKNIWLTSRRTDLKILVILGCIVVALISVAAFKFWAARPFHASYDIVGNFATDADTDAAAIRQDWPHRLVQPQWVSSASDLFGNWTKAETFARSVVVGVVWFVVTGLLVSKYLHLSKVSIPAAPLNFDHQFCSLILEQLGAEFGDQEIEHHALSFPRDNFVQWFVQLFHDAGH